jgi:hypothetical protein
MATSGPESILPGFLDGRTRSTNIDVCGSQRLPKSSYQHITALLCKDVRVDLEAQRNSDLLFKATLKTIRTEGSLRQ